MTPLLKWNPYNLEYKGRALSPFGKTVTANGRWGSTHDAAKAYNGTNSKHYYQTPYEFFVSGEQGSSQADTVLRSAGVLDRAGQFRRVKASGTRVFMPYIPGVGSLRTRYPIMPVHGEGSAVWKELEALKDIILEPVKFAHMFRQHWQDLRSEGVVLLTGKAPADGHVHRVVLSADDVSMLKLGRAVLVETEVTKDHNHEVLIKMISKGRYYMVKCDGAKSCFDKHFRTLIMDKANAMSG